MSNKNSPVTHIDHIGIAVRSLSASLPIYRDLLGLELVHEDEVESQGVRVAFFQLGQTTIELLEPTRDDSPIAKFIERKGEGIHHIAMATDDIDAARQRASDWGARLLSDEPIDGAHGKLISFLHPKDTGSVLMEFCMQRRGEEQD